MGDERVTVDTGQPVPRNGYYTYLEHVEAAAGRDVPPVDRRGIFLVRDSLAPALVPYGPPVRWRLHPPPATASGCGEEVTVITDRLVRKDGHYSYLRHVSDGIDCDAHPAAKRGMFLARGSLAPGLVTCNHDVCWKLDLPPS